MLDTKQRHTPKGGYSIRQFAAELNLPEKRVRRAVDLEEIEAVDFGGVIRIPPREVERLRGLYK
ncbi:hypothetical protein [Mesorhizobium sp.]|uniref:hypothetical protein n=1 Tax=Mesorhizobium sp. TaxID=1871066 RepID=UPI000FE9E3F6|nr:hypothetical protein [Mesorhizobium sp.]RWO55395.1 MAG: DNA-binding protein [Mesorhizobium sp.]